MKKITVTIKLTQAYIAGKLTLDLNEQEWTEDGFVVKPGDLVCQAWLQSDEHYNAGSELHIHDLFPVSFLEKIREGKNVVHRMCTWVNEMIEVTFVASKGFEKSVKYYMAEHGVY